MNNFEKGQWIVVTKKVPGRAAEVGAMGKIYDTDSSYIYIKWKRKSALDKKLVNGQADGGYVRNGFEVYKEIPKGFQTKDSGKRQEFSTGMVRDTQEDKARYDLIYLPLLKRWAELMARGATKYGERNWEKAETEEELNRFKSSAFRHFMQYLDGEDDEDHAAAVLFNIGGMEMVKSKLKK